MVDPLQKSEIEIFVSVSSFSIISDSLQIQVARGPTVYAS